jgi:glycosyltransferase involved in cell wall biosynthesis
MKIIHCLKYFLPAQVAGTEVYVASLCAGLKELGIDVLIVKPSVNITVPAEYFYNDLRVIEYPESPVVDKALITGKRKPEGLYAFENILEQEKPDAIHFHEISGSNGITIHHLRIAKNLGIPVFTTLHLVGYVCKTGTLKYKNKFDCDGVIIENKCARCVLHSRGFRFGMAELMTTLGRVFINYPAYIHRHKGQLSEIFTLSKKVFVLSNWYKDVLLKNGMFSQKIIYVPQGLPDFSGEMNVSYVPGETLRLIYMGRISHEKGLDVLINALREIAGKNWVLDIYGKITDTKFADKCNKLASKISNRISWKGVVKPTEVISILANYDALILPSNIQEMAPLLIQEAFAAKLPVIASDVSGVAEQISDGLNGLLFSRGDSSSLCKQLAKVIDNREILFRLKQNIKTPVGFDKVAMDIAGIYKRELEVKEESTA